MPRSTRPGPPVKTVRPIRFAAVDADELSLNLSDLPRAAPSLNVDGFAPSMTSRLLDLVDRLRGS